MENNSTPFDINFEYFNWIQTADARFSVAVRLDCPSKGKANIIAPLGEDEEKYLRMLKEALCEIYPE